VTDGLSIPFFSASRQIHSRTVTLTRTWTSAQGVVNTGAADWVTWIKRSGSAPASQIASRRDEETGTRSEIQTRIEEISEVERDGEISVHVEVRKDSLNVDHTTSEI
jgi:hypothetical protein